MAAVIGGGLLGLEAARGLQVQSCTVSVIHLMDTLMERQLDSTGSALLAAQMERMGVGVMLGRSTSSILGNEKVEGLRFKDGGTIEADLVVIAAGIRPNAGLARDAGLAVNRGIVVNDYLEASHPDIYAVGECVEHRGVCYGLVAPLLEQGKVLAATITDNRGPVFESALQAAKLKIMGVEVFSAGEWDEKKDPAAEVVRYEDPSLGLYKKLLLRDGRLTGFILVGDTAESPRYLDWLKRQNDLTAKRRHILFPPPVEDAGMDMARLAESETVCGCMGVTKGEIIHAVHETGVATLAQLEEFTTASTGCGSCTSLCQQLLKTVAIGSQALRDPRFKMFKDLPEDLFEAFLSVPILCRGKLVGVINLQHRQPYRHTREEVRLISMLGFLVGAEIERARLESENFELSQQLETRKALERAKAILQRDFSMSEEEAHRTLHRESRQRRKSMREIAEAIVLNDDLRRGRSAPAEASHSK
jgi:NAD(P)H-nitrite reductase large subunit